MRTPTSSCLPSPTSIVALAIFVATTGCAPSVYTPESQAPSNSGYSSSIGSSMSSSSMSSGGESFVAPQRGTQRGELVVRPDMISIVFALKRSNQDPQKAIASLQEAAAGVLARMQEATSNAATMTMCGASVNLVSEGKSADEPPSYVVVVDGSIDVRLTPEQDYWARSRLIASITRAMKALTSAPKDESAHSAIHFNQPQLTLKDPEAHRGKLVERWVKRARELADAAQSPAAPLYLVDCAAPAAIEVRAISLEEVGLSLAVACRLDALRGPTPPK